MSRFLHVVAVTGLIIAGVMVALLLFALVFLKVWKPFGGKADEADRKDYAARAANYDGKKFHNMEDFSVLGGQEKAEPDPLTLSRNGTRPDFEFPTKAPGFLDQEDRNARLAKEECRVTWFGHSSLLVQTHGLNILIDPVFSEMISPVSFVGSRRFSSPSVTVGDLPEIDILLQSHDHYDHLDYDVIREIDGKVRRYIVPLGVENHLERWGVSPGKITNMAWWEETDEAGLTVACTPSQHFSGRCLIDSMETLWCSWVLKDEYRQLFVSGDSGYGSHWQSIHEKYGDFDFVMMECGQYDVHWPRVHSFPEQSVDAVKTLGAKTALPVHWGAIVLSRHGWDDPVERFLLAAEKEGITVLTPCIGQTVDVGNPSLFTERWWRSPR